MLYFTLKWLKNPLYLHCKFQCSFTLMIIFDCHNSVRKLKFRELASQNCLTVKPALKFRTTESSRVFPVCRYFYYGTHFNNNHPQSNPFIQEHNLHYLGCYWYKVIPNFVWPWNYIRWRSYNLTKCSCFS